MANIHSGNGVFAGAYPTDLDGNRFPAGDFRFTQNGENAALVDFGAIRFTLMESWMEITADEDFAIEAHIGKTDRRFPTLVSWDDRALRLRYDGMEYGMELTVGHFDGTGKIRSENGMIELKFV